MALLSFQRGDLMKASGLVDDWRKNALDIEAQRQNMKTVAQVQQLNEMKLESEKLKMAGEQKMYDMIHAERPASELRDFVSRFAPKTADAMDESLRSGGVINERDTFTGFKMNTYIAQNPQLASQWAASAISEIDQDLPMMKKLASGYYERDENGNMTKFVPPDKNADMIKGQIKEKENARIALVGMLGSKPQQEAVAREQIAELRPEATAKVPASIQAYQLAVGQGYKGTFEEWTLALKKAGAMQNVLNVENYVPANVTAQQEFMKSVKDNFDRLKDAPAQITNIEEAKKLVSTNNPLLGSFGNVKLGVAKFFRNNLGFDITNVENVQNAEELRTRLFSQIMDNLKKLDAQPSQMQQQIMQESLGKLDTDPSALPKILDAIEAGIKNRVILHNQIVDKADPRIQFPFDPHISIEPMANTTQETKVINGVTYIKINGQWYTQ